MRVLLVDSAARRERIRSLLDSSGSSGQLEVWAQPFDPVGPARIDWHAGTRLFLFHVTDYWSIASDSPDMNAIDAALRTGGAIVFLYSGGGLTHYAEEGRIVVVDDQHREFPVMLRAGRLCVFRNPVVEGDEPAWDALLAMREGDMSVMDACDVFHRAVDGGDDAAKSLARTLFGRSYVPYESLTIDRIAIWADADSLLRAMAEIFVGVTIDPLRNEEDLRRLLSSSIEPVDIIALMPTVNRLQCLRWVHLLRHSRWEGRCVAMVPPDAIQALPAVPLWGDSTSVTLDRLLGFSWLAIPADIKDVMEALDRTAVLYRETWLQIERDANVFRLGMRLEEFSQQLPTPLTFRSLAADLGRIEWHRVLPHTDARVVRDAIGRFERTAEAAAGTIAREILHILKRYNLFR